jgi:putative ABC transport system permease protein
MATLVHLSLCPLPSLTTVAATLNTPTGKDQIERLLALGASRSEATSDLLTRSTKLAMTPLLNQMSVVGLVSIPGVCRPVGLKGASNREVMLSQ